MTDGQADETPRGMAGRRALGAMESAVLRARASQGGAPPPLPPRPSSAPTPRRHGRVTVPTRSSAKPADPARPDRWLITSISVVGALVVLAAIALAASLTGSTTPQAPSPSTATTPAPTHAGAAPPSGQSQAKGHHTPRGTSGTSTTTSTTTPLLAAPGGPPVIGSLTPSSGSAGQSVRVTGAGFLSSSGQIVARFNGQVAATSCPAQNTCTVTVPPPSGDRSALVTITTADGTSNAVTFAYHQS
jgi:hypothetical protein